MKTPLDLIDAAYELLDVTEVQSAMLSGDIFKTVKPDNYQGECIVINSLPVSGQQLQRGFLNVNIYAPNLTLKINGQPDNSQPNTKRLKEIAAAVVPILEDATADGNLFFIDSMNVYAEDQNREHFLNIRIVTRSPNL